MAKKKTSEFDENLDNLREVMGVWQHHDAVTGTEKQHVAEDYARLLQIGIDKCSKNINYVLNQLTAKNGNTDFDANYAKFDYVNCADLNISSCEITETTNKFMVTLYNPLSQTTSQYVRVPITDGEYEILDYQNRPVKSQTISVPMEIQALSYRRSKAKMELVFRATDLPPLGFKSYSIKRKLKSLSSAAQKLIRDDVDDINDNKPFTIGNEYLNLTFDENGLLTSAANKDVQMKVRQNFFKYESPSNIISGRPSGAYIFRPRTQALEMSKRAKVRVIRGNLVDEVHQV